MDSYNATVRAGLQLFFALLGATSSSYSELS